MFNEFKYTTHPGGQNPTTPPTPTPTPPEQGQPYGNGQGQRQGQNLSQSIGTPNNGGGINRANGAAHQETDEVSSMSKVKLTGRLVQPPNFNPRVNAGYANDRVELTFQIARGGNKPKLFNLSGTRRPVATEKVVVSCRRVQFAEIERQLKPQTCLEVLGTPIAVCGPDGRPYLSIECNHLKVIPFGWRERLAKRKTLTLVICWVIILGGIAILNVALPRQTPPGLLALALLLGSARVIESLEFVPESIKKVIQRYQLRVLLLVTVVLAIWFFVQYSYYTTPRFR